MDFKFCKKCNQDKPVCDFYKSSTRKSGFLTPCKKCINESSAKYNRENSEKIKEYHEEYRRENPEKIKEHSAKYYRKNREKIKSRRAKYYRKNREKHKEYCNKRYKNDENFKIRRLLRSRILHALKVQSAKKSNKTLELIGCSVNELWEHLEGQFTDGMTRQNQGEWHIDHIKPCAAFDLTDPKQQKECFNYKNLQPLWAQDNLKKSDKWEEPE